MPNRPTLRECPERVHGHAPLFAHQIPLSLCAERQTALYHKCFSCAHFRGHDRPEPVVLEPLAPPREAERRAPGPLPTAPREKPVLVPARLKVG